MIKLALVLVSVFVIMTYADIGSDIEASIRKQEAEMDKDFKKDIEADTIRNLKPKEGQEVDGKFESHRTEKKIVNGKVVKDKEKDQEIENENGKVTESKYEN